MSDENEAKPFVELPLIQKLEKKIKDTEKRLDDLKFVHSKLKKNPELEVLVTLLRRIS